MKARIEALDPEVVADLTLVTERIARLGAADGVFITHVVGTLLARPTTTLPATVALLAARAISDASSDAALELASVSQIVYAASLAHGPKDPDTPDDADGERLVVLAGDYLYAQAAVKTAALQNLELMALLSETIKVLCRQSSRQAPMHADSREGGAEGQWTSGHPGLFTLSALGMSLLLHAHPRQAGALNTYGSSLDAAMDFSRNHSIPPTELRIMLGNERARAHAALEPLQASSWRVSLGAVADTVTAIDWESVGAATVREGTASGHEHRT